MRVSWSLQQAAAYPCCTADIYLCGSRHTEYCSAAFRWAAAQTLCSPRTSTSWTDLLQWCPVLSSAQRGTLWTVFHLFTFNMAFQALIHIKGIASQRHIENKSIPSEKVQLLTIIAWEDCLSTLKNVNGFRYFLFGHQNESKTYKVF